ncbi:MAG: hypothetical protein WCR52_24290, partial [Bacteroidota bacterium]
MRPNPKSPRRDWNQTVSLVGTRLDSRFLQFATVAAQSVVGIQIIEFGMVRGGSAGSAYAGSDKGIVQKAQSSVCETNVVL